ncbi:MAG: hypothetical protein R6X35_02620 [Candidatus Krumholzibacteriia bacterium]
MTHRPHFRLPRPAVLAAPFVLLAVGLAACAGRVETVHTSPGFARADLATGRLGVGGVVLASRLTLDPALAAPTGVPVGDVLAQADALAGSLYGPLLAAGPGVPVWPWPAVREAGGDSLLAGILDAFARGGVLRPAQLAPLAAALGEVRYLALARVEKDEITLDQSAEAAIEKQRARDGRDVHAGSLDTALKTRRKLTVTLDVYDLAAGRSVWTATAERHRDQFYDFTGSAAGEPPSVVPTGEPVITADGRPLPTADFTDVLDDACKVLARRLLVPPEDGASR